MPNSDNARQRSQRRPFGDGGDVILTSLPPKHTAVRIPDGVIERARPHHNMPYRRNHQWLVDI